MKRALTPYDPNSSNSALMNYFENLISSEKPDEMLAASALSEIQNDSGSTKTNKCVEKIFCDDAKLQKIVTRMADRRYKEVQHGVEIYPDQKIIALFKTKGDDECKKILKDLSKAIQKKLGDFPSLLLSEHISKILCLAGYKVGISHDSHSRLKNLWIDYINENQASLGVIAPSFTGIAHYLTGEEDLDKAVVKFPTFASQIKHLSFDQIECIASSKRWNDYLRKFQNRYPSFFYQQQFSIDSFVKINELLSSIKNTKCVMLDENLLIEDTNCQIQYLHTIAKNNITLEKLIYRHLNYELIAEILPYFSNLKILDLSHSRGSCIPKYEEKELRRIEKQILNRPNLYPTLKEMHYSIKTGEFFKRISNYKLLEKLYLNFHPYTNGVFCDEFIQLKGLPIEELGLSNFSHSEENLNFMKKISEALPKLKKIYLENFDLINCLISDLANFLHLEEITFRAVYSFHHCDFEDLNQCPSLKTLRLETRSALKESGLEAIRKALPGVQVVNIIDPNIDPRIEDSSDADTSDSDSGE